MAPESYVIGGAVRDRLLGHGDCADIDVAIQGDGYDTAKAVADIVGGTFVPLDKRHGTGRIAFKDKEAVELDISSFKGESIQDDLVRRDFTINAMALSPEDFLSGETGNVIDPCEGMKDIGRRLIRACSLSAFEEDPLRMLRAYRFSSLLGFDIERKSLELIERNIHRISSVSGERIRDELVMILKSDESAASLHEMDMAGLIDALLPELSPLKGLEQNYHHHLNVWDHTLEALKRLERLTADAEILFENSGPEVAAYLNYEPVYGRPRTALLKLAVLFHDAGKPETMSVGEDGRIHFFGHEQLSKGLFEQAASRLKLSSRETRAVSLWIESHMRPIYLVSESFPKRGVIRLNRKLGEDVVGLYLLYLADLMASKGPAKADGEDERALLGVKKALGLHFESERSPIEPLLSGRDLINELHLKPGPILGYLLNEIFQLQIQGDVGTRDEALEEARRLLDEGAGSK